eukprot:7968148-Heterocapsa_arctica.AAC.1
MGDYGALRRGLFRFLDRGRAFGNEGQLQGVPMELDALTSPPTATRPWARTVTPKGKGGGKFGGKAVGAGAATARRNEAEG